jgi:predicted TIM-barrel fold metal-dependent hydrolase
MAIDVPIIDAHHHLWIDPPFPQFQTFPIEQLAAMRAATGNDMRATVFVDCRRDYLTDGPEELRPIGETRTVETEAHAAASSGGPAAGIAAAIVGQEDMRLGSGIEPVLLAHLDESPTRFRGIRHMTPWHLGMSFFDLPIDEHMLCTPAFAEGLAALAKLDLTFDAWVLSTQLRDVVELARSVPAATVVLNHAGTPLAVGPWQGRADEVFSIWRDGMAAVAGCPNVVVKLGGLLMHVTELAPHGLDRPMTADEVATALRRHVRTVIELFEPERCMFESNFPVDGAFAGYSDLWAGFDLITADLTRAERESLFAGTAARTYRIPI